MARANGGEILIRISKDISNITASDFDKTLFKKICDEKITKPLRLQTNNLTIVFEQCSYNFVPTGFVMYRFSNIFLDDGNIDGYLQIIIEYAIQSDSLTFTLEEN